MKNYLAIIIAVLVCMPFAEAFAANKEHCCYAENRLAQQSSAKSARRYSAGELSSSHEARHGGRVLSAKVVERKGQESVEIKWMKAPGRVEVLLVDPASGEQIPTRRGRF